MDKKVSYQEVKDICSLVVDEECKKYNLDLNIHIIGKLEFFKTDFFKDNFKLYKSFLDRKCLISTPFLCSGVYYPPSNDLFIFIDNKLINSNNLTNVLVALYHEIYHSIQNEEHNRDKNSYDWNNFYNFISELEKFAHSYIKSESLRYSEYHDSFMFEMLADTYAIINTRNFMKKHNYKIDYEFLDTCDKNNLFQYECFMGSYLIDVIIDNYKEIKKIDKFKSYNFDIFLDDDGKPKLVDIILKDERIINMDKKIIKSFLISKNFIDSYGKHKLKDSSRNILLDVIKSELDSKSKGR